MLRGCLSPYRSRPLKPVSAVSEGGVAAASLRKHHPDSRQSSLASAFDTTEEMANEEVTEEVEKEEATEDVEEVAAPEEEMEEAVEAAEEVEEAAPPEKAVEAAPGSDEDTETPAVELMLEAEAYTRSRFSSA